MSDEHSPTEESVTDAELDAVVGGTGTGGCPLHGGVAKPHEEWRTSGSYSILYTCNGDGYKSYSGPGRG